MGGEASKVLLPPFSLPFANAFRVRWDARVKALGSMLTKRPSWTLMYPLPPPLSHHLLADTRRIVVTSGRGGGRGTIEETSLLSGWVINLYHLFNKQRQAKLINCANKRATIVETRLRCVVRACVRASCASWARLGQQTLGHKSKWSVSSRCLRCPEIIYQIGFILNND